MWDDVFSGLHNLIRILPHHLTCHRPELPGSLKGVGNTITPALFEDAEGSSCLNLFHGPRRRVSMSFCSADPDVVFQYVSPDCDIVPWCCARRTRDGARDKQPRHQLWPSTPRCPWCAPPRPRAGWRGSLISRSTFPEASTCPHMMTRSGVRRVVFRDPNVSSGSHRLQSRGCRHPSDWNQL